ncbi:MAG: hypothetical protein JWN31_2158 [Frankiales bacterium]|nr:hypothetical protein [Frankiales bacterium]
MKTSALILALASALALSVAGPVPALAEASAEPSHVVSVSTASVVETADYASEVLSDPWDFSNKEDVAGPNGIANGLLTYSPSGKVQPSLLASTASSQPWGNDGRINPLDASRYTYLAMRVINSSATGSAGLSWTTCGWAVTSCRGFQSIPLSAGGTWQTYDVPIAGSGLSSAPAPWSGRVTGLRLTGTSGQTIKVDWVRLHAAGEPAVDLSWEMPMGDRAMVVYWDSDSDPLNNNPYREPGSGVAGYAGAGSSAHIRLAAFPPGRYRFIVATNDHPDDPAAWVATSPWVTVRARPRPLVMTPSASQGADWATTVRRNPWDMTQASDYALHNARVVGSNGKWFAAENTSNDPTVTLPVGRGFAGSTYHRVQIKMALLGGYSLANAPGGGCVGRLLWTTAKGGPGNWQTTDDLVLYPGWNSISLNMTTSPTTAIVDPALGARRLGWAGQTITALRFDPNEDPGKRRWYLDDIKVSADPVSSNGRFDLTFADLVGASGTTAHVEAVDTSNRVRVIADQRPVTPGTNTVSWLPPRSVPVGLYRFRVTITNPAGSVTQWAPVPVRIVPA